MSAGCAALQLLVGGAACGVGVRCGAGDIGCGSSPQEARRPEGCPAFQQASLPLPGVTQAQRGVAYWEKRLEAEGLADELLMRPVDVRALNLAHARGEAQAARQSLRRPLEKEAMRTLVKERVAYLAEKWTRDDMRDASGERWSPKLLPRADKAFEGLTWQPTLRVALAHLPLHCAPFSEGLYRSDPALPEGDKRFDRNRCSTIRPQEPVEVVGAYRSPVAKGEGESMWLVRADYMWGWVREDAAMSRVLTRTEADRVLASSRVRLLEDTEASSLGREGPTLAPEGSWPLGTSLPVVTEQAGTAGAPGTAVAENGQTTQGDGSKAQPATAAKPNAAGRSPGTHVVVWAAGKEGLEKLALPRDKWMPETRAMTRTALLRATFRYVGRPYGWGGAGPGFDCSRFVMEVLGGFGLKYPRNSGQQGRHGSLVVEVPPPAGASETGAGPDGASREGMPAQREAPASEDELAVRDAQIQAVLDRAWRLGAVLVQLDGHVAMYLGRDHEGTPMVVHALAQYAEACGGDEASVRQGDDASSETRQATRGPGQGSGQAAGQAAGQGSGQAAGQGSQQADHQTLHDVFAVEVSRLSLGDKSHKGSLLRRIRRIVVIGAQGREGQVYWPVAGVAAHRKPSAIDLHGACREGCDAKVQRKICGDKQRGVKAAGTSSFLNARSPASGRNDGHGGERLALAGLYEGRKVDTALSPTHPVAGKPVRVWLTSEATLGPLAARVVDPGGKDVPFEVLAQEGPPYGRVFRFVPSRAGDHLVVIGEGDAALVCETLHVRPKGWVMADPMLARAKAQDDGREQGVSLGAWRTKRMWSPADERRFATFVSQLFAEGPSSGAPSWTDLHTPLREEPRNLLHDHLGLGEDDALAMQPDCADLPYDLRLYFAWKMGLPFGFRGCTRGRAGEPPRCGAPRSHEDPIAGAGTVAKFRALVREVHNQVHSASARTAPDDEETDLYPVALTREALRPGAVFADPHGHLLVAAKWTPPTFSSDGVLTAADAQPDGTLARRVFWQGNFLFSPDTTHVGAGFKTWRLLERNPEHRKVAEAPAFVGMDNARMARRPLRAMRFSMAQYAGTKQAFYRRVEELIHPLPRSPDRLLRGRIDALQEMVESRVVSVQNGVDYVKSHPGKVIPMPDGKGIFLTSGPWEDFSTPSRDMRLLVSMDTVRALPDEMVARGEQDKDDAEGMARLRAKILKALKARSFSYENSDGDKVPLTLEDLYERGEALEMAYNPNDCPERRWGAADASPEGKTCKRRAPKAQREKMQAIRAWFRDRERPVR